ncbi:MAG: hypothetical protein UV36_C0006G0003 [Parcubacteria group bacterium GW2011_GWC2_42_6]|nr:MAG: hypothetical protein UV36_C0006G0003 [Parcubacteria group bacterium GW2011_GWC2_42_6]
MKRGGREVVLLLLFLANLGWVSQADAEKVNQNNSTLTITADISKEEEYLLLNILADKSTANPILSCEFLLEYDANALQFVEYRPRQNWLKNVTKEKGKIKILQVWPFRYDYWLIGEQFYLGTFKFKLINKTRSVEFTFKNPVIVQIDWISDNPEVNKQALWPKKIRKVLAD